MDEKINKSYTPIQDYLISLRSKFGLDLEDYDFAKKNILGNRSLEKELLGTLHRKYLFEAREDFNMILKKPNIERTCSVMGESLAYGIYNGEFDDDEIRIISQRNYADEPIHYYMDRGIFLKKVEKSYSDLLFKGPWYRE